MGPVVLHEDVPTLPTWRRRDDTDIFDSWVAPHPTLGLEASGWTCGGYSGTSVIELAGGG